MSSAEPSADPRRYRALVDAFADFLWFCSADGRLVGDMPAWRAVTGQTREQLLGYGWLDGVHPDDRARVIASWKDAVARRAAFSSTYRLVGNDGTRWLDVRGAPVLGEDDAVREWVGTAVDVTDREERREVEAGLRASLARERDMFEHVISQAPIAVAVLEGPEHRFRVWNALYLDLVPAGRELAGRSVVEVMPETRENAVPLLDRAYGGETIEMAELPVPFEDPRSFDGHRYYDFMYSPIREDGEPVGVLVTAAEVTGKVRHRGDLARRLEEERRLAEQLQRALVPAHLADLDGVALATRYVPASAATGVGGDWYDALEVTPGCVLLVMGDVCGKGLDAATAMSQLRPAIRAYALTDPDPAAILRSTSAYVEDFRIADLVTLSVALLDVETATVRIANAGHLPPLVVAADGTPSYALVHADPPLGTGHRAYRDAVVTLKHGDRIAFFTDGAVEHRDRSLADTLEDLRAAVEDAPGPLRAGADDLCDLLHAHVRATGAGADDAALLVCAIGAGAARHGATAPRRALG